MKRIIPHTANCTAVAPLLLAVVAMFASATLLSGCSESELPGGDENVDPSLTAFTIQVTDGGYDPAEGETSHAAGEQPATRTTENSYATQFTAGDKIGVFAVKNGNIVSTVNNLCLVAVEGASGDGTTTTLEWQTTDGGTLEIPNDVTCYAYYPYQEMLNGTLVPATPAPKAAAFFADVIRKWTPTTDQSTHAAYTASDLMIASCTSSDQTLSFSMQHQMALVVIEVPKIRYRLTDADGKGLPPDYITDACEMQFNSSTPYRMDDGTYRYLINPAAAVKKLSGGYISPTTEWEFVANAGAGQYNEYIIDGGSGAIIEKSHKLQPGDFYMKDGSLLSKDTKFLSAAQQVACLGVVYYVADITQDDPLLKKDHPDCTHGLVVALRDAAESLEWSSEEENISQQWLASQGEKYCISSLKTGDKMQGYANTKALKDYNLSLGGDKLGYQVLPINSIETYASIYPAPTNSSDWYFCSVMELKYMCWGQGETEQGRKGADMLDAQLKKVGESLPSLQSDYYWSSTEGVNTWAWYVGFYTGNVDSYRKYSNRYGVRAVLAF